MGVNIRNSEGYYDPTAYEALSNIEREAKAARAFRPIVYICSPLSGDMDANQEAARRYCRYAVDSGYIPIAPHIYFTQFMNEHSPKERNLALFMDNVPSCGSLETPSPKECPWRSKRPSAKASLSVTSTPRVRRSHLYENRCRQ